MPRAAQAPTPGEVAALLAARAGALRTHDAAALPVGGATAGAEGSEPVARIAAVPLAALEYRTPTRAAPGPDRRPVVDAVLAVRVEGYDDHPALFSRRITLIRGAGPRGARPWRVEREEAAGGAVPLWDLGTVEAAAGTHCLVLGTAGAATAPAALVPVADRAVAAVSAAWGTGWAGRLLLEVPATEDGFARLLDVPPADWAGMAAVTSAAAGAPAGTPADRVLINPEAYQRLSELGRQVVVTHEATHVATRADTRPWTPLWLSEGVADWTAYRETGRTARQIAPELTRDVAAGRLPTALPTAADLAPGAKDIAQAYELSWLACELIARRYGPERLVGLYRAVGAAGAGAAPERRLDLALRATLGTGLADFTALWIAETRRQLAGG